MKGFVICSHGKLAEGMKNTLQMFFGENIEQTRFLSLSMDEEVDEYSERMKKAVDEVDTGEGVIIFTDMLGGTPNNCAMNYVDNCDVVCGYNMPMLMNFLTKRESDYEIRDLIEESKTSMLYVNELNREAEDDDF